MKVDPIKELRIGTTRLNWLNYSNIVLVPKKEIARSIIRDFRPIACLLITMLKTKVLANRIALLLQSLPCYAA